MDKNGNTFEMKIAPEVGSIYADQMKVRQSLLNLLSNAAKFTTGGSVLLEADLADSGGDVVLRVSDTGIGISAENLSLLFQPFQQAESDTTRQFGGTGLGLVLTRRFCEMMGGEVTVKSEPGQGSVFTIRLPRGAASPRSADAGQSRKNNGTVLIIDDDPVSSDLLQRLLHAGGVRDGTRAER